MIKGLIIVGVIVVGVLIREFGQYADEMNPYNRYDVKTPLNSRESHEKKCETCRDKDTYDEWQGNCDECENGSMYTPQTETKGADDE